MKTCGNCVHAVFVLTPKGRVKRRTPGRCTRADSMIDQFLSVGQPPCLAVARPHRVAIWPDYMASGCPEFTQK
jgi:hypothetical protein